MKIKKGFVLRDVAGETVVVPTGGVTNLNMMITLNESGKLLWEKLSAGAEPEALIDALLNEYDIDRETVIKSTEAFISRLKELDIIE